MATLPEGFVKKLESYGAQALDGLCETLVSTPPSVSIRINPLKGISVPDGAEQVPWCSNGIYLDSREAFTFDPALHQGLYYAQDASSMIVAFIADRLSSGQPVHYLDACAAPGGKTTAALSVLPQGSLTVANEFVPARAAVLAENIAKWGNPDVIVTKGDTARMRHLPDFFDIIAADVPCSGEGMMRKDPAAVAQWSERLIEECAARQREIIDNLWPSLRPGGYLIYSTCTFNTTENEQMLQYIVDNYNAQPVDLQLETMFNGIVSGIGTSHPCWRMMPHHLRGEGLFVAVVQKTADSVSKIRIKTPKVIQTDKKIRQIIERTAKWLLNPGDFDISATPDFSVIRAVNHAHAKDAAIIGSVLDVVSSGVELAVIKGHDAIPSQALAMTTVLNKEAFACHEIDYPAAIAYLRREAITLPDCAATGYVLLTYCGHPLGFVKNIGNRANNLYPQPWRILSSHVPDIPPEVISRHNGHVSHGHSINK